MNRIVLAALAALLLVAPLFGQELPAEKWWRKPELVKRIGITGDQQTKLDGVFKANATELIDLRADLEKRMIALRDAVDNPDLDRDAIQRAAAQVSEARARLFEREVLMMVDMRGTLSTDQWGKLRTALNAPRQQPPGGRLGPGIGRPGMGGARPPQSGPGRRH